VRVGVSGQLVTRPEARAHAPGAFLMRAYMKGAQDLTVTDTASKEVRRIWEGVGGETFHLACVGWFRVFRPWQFARAYRARAEHAHSTRSQPLLAGLDAASTLFGRVLRPLSRRVTSLPATPRDLVEHLPTVTGGFRLKPAYDLGYLEWLVPQLAAVTPRGELRIRLVESGGRVHGWYVYYLQRGGIGQVLQVAAEDRNAADVLDGLLSDAYDAGAAGLQGRVEPHLRAALAERSLFHRSGYLALIQSRDPTLSADVQAGRALLTRLDGEWWMGHHVLPFR
jgi:hypothetical protein